MLRERRTYFPLLKILIPPWGLHCQWTNFLPKTPHPETILLEFRASVCEFVVHNPTEHATTVGLIKDSHNACESHCLQHSLCMCAWTHSHVFAYMYLWTHKCAHVDFEDTTFNPRGTYCCTSVTLGILRAEQEDRVMQHHCHLPPSTYLTLFEPNVYALMSYEN